MSHHYLTKLLAVAVVGATASLLPLSGADAATTPYVATSTARAVVSQRLPMTLVAKTVRGRSVTVGAKAHPAVKGRLVTYSAKAPGGSWKVIAKARERRHGWAPAKVTFATSGVWRVRATLARRGRFRAVAGPVRSVRVTPSSVPTVMAHRGGAGEGPENTMAAFRRAILDGATTLETDVQATSDGHLVLFHDATPARTTDVAERFPGRENDDIGTFTLAELETLDAGASKGQQWTGERIATFDELLALVRSAHVSLLAEAKLPLNSPGLEQDMVDRVRAARLISRDTNSRVVFESFDVDSLRRIREFAPDANVSPILWTYPTDITTLGWANSITLRSSATTRARVVAAHRAGLEVNVWSPNSAAEFYAFADAGVDAIITDYPRLALSTLR